MIFCLQVLVDFQKFWCLGHVQLQMDRFRTLLGVRTSYLERLMTYFGIFVLGVRGYHGFQESSRLLYIRLPYIRLPYIRSHCIRLPYIRLPYIRLPYIRLPYIRILGLDCIRLPYIRILCLHVVLLGVCIMEA